MKKLFKILLFIILVATLPICASENIVWPGPPDKPRISFEQVIQKSSDLKIEKGFFSKIFDYVFGDEEKALIKPFGVHIGINHKIYVADTGASSVFVFDKKNNEFKTIEGSKDQNFVSPIDIKTDHGNVVYVTDSVLRKIFVFDKNGDFLRFFASDFNFKRPTGLVINNIKEIIYVSDTVNNTIETFSFDGRHISTIGKYGNNEMEFNKPTFLAIDSDENIYVSDSMNQRIQIFDVNNKFIREFGEIGKVPGTFANPRGIAVDKDKNIYVSDTLFNAIQIFNNKGQLLLNIGQQGKDNSSFSLPAGISIEDDLMYIADSYNMRIGKFKIIRYKE